MAYLDGGDVGAPDSRKKKIVVPVAGGNLKEALDRLDEMKRQGR